MAIRTIQLEGAAILQRPTIRLKRVDARVRGYLQDMMDTLHATENGAALAAPQVGLPFALVVIDMDDRVYRLVNPCIVSARGAQECVEGCLSIPGKYGVTTRPSRVKVKALNEWGRPITIYATGDMAKCLCHEIDHLDGVLYSTWVERWL